MQGTEVPITSEMGCDICCRVNGLCRNPSATDPQSVGLQLKMTTMRTGLERLELLKQNRR